MSKTSSASTHDRGGKVKGHGAEFDIAPPQRPDILIARTAHSSDVITGAGATHRLDVGSGLLSTQIGLLARDSCEIYAGSGSV